MKIIHCADLHLDSAMTSNLDREKAAQRRRELLAAFERMIDYAVDNGVEAIIIAGDLFDTRTVTATVRNAVYKAIKDNPQITYYYLKGNHDSDNFLSNLEEIPSNLKMFGKTWLGYELETSVNGRVMLTGIELDSDNAQTAYDTLKLEKSDMNIVVLHGQEAEHMSKDKAEVIAFNQLRNKGIDYLALGHVHVNKSGRLDARGVYCYPGCLEGRGFDECGDHGFMVLNIDASERKLDWEFVSCAFRRLNEVNVDVTGSPDSTEIIQKVKNKLQQRQIRSIDMVKVVLTGEVDLDCDVNENYIFDSFCQGYYFAKLYNKLGYRVDYNDYVNDESLKGEFVRNVMNEVDISESDKAEIIKYGIRMLRGEAIE